MGNYETLVLEQEVLKHLTGPVIPGKSPRGDTKNEVFPILSGLIFAFAVGPFLSAKWFWISEIEKG
jgi:hypothetical protein